MIIIAGVLILSFDKKSGESIVFQQQMVWLMVGSSFIYALYEILFKVIAIQATFWVSLFWQNIGLLLTGLLFYFFVASYHRDFHYLLKNNGPKIIGLNCVNEVLNTAAIGLIQYALMLAPAALVLMVNSLQPVFVFLIGILITLFWPKISQENISRPVLLQKSAALIIILIGTYFLYF